MPQAPNVPELLSLKDEPEQTHIVTKTKAVAKFECEFCKIPQKNSAAAWLSDVHGGKIRHRRICQPCLDRR